MLLGGARGFEPPTTCTPRKYATRLRYAPTRTRIVSVTLFTKHLQNRLQLFSKF